MLKKILVLASMVFVAAPAFAYDSNYRWGYKPESGDIMISINGKLAEEIFDGMDDSTIYPNAVPSGSIKISLDGRITCSRGSCNLRQDVKTGNLLVGDGNR